MFRILTLGATLVALALPAGAEPTTIGGDLYAAGSDVATAPASERDAFFAGANVVVTKRTEQDLHAMGFSISVEAETGADLYAAGANVTLRAPVGADTTASGFTVRTTPGAETAGNARISGGDVTIQGPVQGALTAAGGEVLFDAAVGGDVWLTAGSLRFGEDAQVGGTLHYTAPTQIEVPANVAPADRVQYYPPADRAPWTDEARDWAEDWDDRWEGPGPVAVITGILLTLAFLVAIGAIFLGLMPDRVAGLEHRARTRPWISLLAGIVGLSALFGLVPVTAMTLIGLPLTPVVLLAIIVFWTLGYLLGVYVLSRRLAIAFGVTVETRGMELAVLAVGLIVAALLNFVPVLGWILNTGLLLLGLGAMTMAIAARLPRDEQDMPAAPAATPTAAPSAGMDPAARPSDDAGDTPSS